LVIKVIAYPVLTAMSFISQLPYESLQYHILQNRIISTIKFCKLKFYNNYDTYTYVYLIPFIINLYIQVSYITETTVKTLLLKRQMLQKLIIINKIIIFDLQNNKACMN